MLLYQNILSCCNNKFRFVIAALFCVMGLQQVSAIVFNDDSNNHFAASEHLQFNSVNTQSTDYNFWVEEIEEQVEEREDDEKQHCSGIGFLCLQQSNVSFSTTVFAHFFVPIHLRDKPTECVATQKIPLYALQCAWRHHLA